MNTNKGGTTKKSQGIIKNKTIMWKDLREHMDWGVKTKDSRGHIIDKERGCKYGFSPKMFWNIGSKHKGESNFKYMPFFPFGHTIFLWGINT